MRIAMVSEHASPLAALGEVDAGGQNLHVAELSAALCQLGHEVTVYTRRDDPRVPERVEAPAGYAVVHVPAGPARYVPKDELLPHMGDFARYLAGRWEHRGPDVVHSHFWMSGLASLLAARPLDIPVVHTFHALGTVKRRHQGAADTSPRRRIGIERMIGRSAARIAATCTDEVIELARMGMPRRQTTVIPCGVDTDQFQPDGPAPSKGRGHRVVSVGRLVPRKGFADLLVALRACADTELLIIGGPPADRLAADPEARRLRALATELRMTDRVRLTGQVTRDRMPGLLRSADLVACVPWYEPFGIVPLEAMACGTPVLATAVGGLTDTVVDGVTGVHVPPRQPQRLGAVMSALLRDKVRRGFLGAAGRDRMESRYQWHHIAEATARIYRRSLAEAAVRMPVDMPEPAYGSAGGAR